MTDDTSTNPYASPLADPNHPRLVYRTFCGLQPLWFTPDRFYKIYVTDTGLYAGWIGGQFHDKLSVRCQLSPLYLVLIGFVVVEAFAMWVDNRRRRLQSLYDSLISDPDNFLNADRRNFMLERNNIKSITISSRKSYWTLWRNSGIIHLTPIDGHPVCILVRDDRELHAIVDELIAAHYHVENVA